MAGAYRTGDRCTSRKKSPMSMPPRSRRGGVATGAARCAGSALALAPESATTTSHTIVRLNIAMHTAILLPAGMRQAIFARLQLSRVSPLRSSQTRAEDGLLPLLPSSNSKARDTLGTPPRTRCECFVKFNRTSSVMCLLQGTTNGKSECTESDLNRRVFLNFKLSFLGVQRRLHRMASFGRTAVLLLVVALSCRASGTAGGPAVAAPPRLALRRRTTFIGNEQHEGCGGKLSAVSGETHWSTHNQVIISTTATRASNEAARAKSPAVWLRSHS